MKAALLHSRAIIEANQGQPELDKVDPAAFQHRKKRLKDGYEAGVISIVDLRERLAQIQNEEEATRRVAVVRQSLSLGRKLMS